MENVLIEIPEMLENLQLPSPELLNYYKNLEDRVLWIDADIDVSLLELSKIIMRWNKEDELKNIGVENRKPIKLYVFSYGGDLHSCLNFLDICSLSKTPIITVNTGVAMSAGLLILLAGHKRYCLKKSQALLHEGSGGAMGTHTMVVAQTNAYKKLMEITRDFVIERTKLDIKLYNKKKKDEWYIFADEQVELGFVDAIVTDLNEII